MDAVTLKNTTLSCDNNATTVNNWTADCVISGGPDGNIAPPPTSIDSMTWILVIADGAILSVGLVGNSLVIYVVARYARMKTVTNVYILNLSIADLLFLVGMPMIMTTALLRRWVFGAVLCHVFYALTSVNMITGAFTLTLMSADRFAAVWFPVSSTRYRTPSVAAAAAALAWVVSGAVMFPVVLYAEHLARPTRSASEAPTYSCTVNWPAEQALTAVRTYVGYTAAIGFLLPVSGVCVFYALLIARLRSTRRHISSITSKQHPIARRSVTCFVAIIVAVFVVCWLPYWCFQVRYCRT